MSLRQIGQLSLWYQSREAVEGRRGWEGGGGGAQNNTSGGLSCLIDGRVESKSGMGEGGGGSEKRGGGGGSERERELYVWA